MNDINRTEPPRRSLLHCRYLTSLVEMMAARQDVGQITRGCAALPALDVLVPPQKVRIQMAGWLSPAHLPTTAVCV